MEGMTWELFERQVEECRLCGLCGGIHHKVPGQGDHASPLMFIGEGPGRDEDEQGLAFVGAAGQLLTRMLEAIRLPRERVYICNIVKCRPPNNRVPTPEEAEADSGSNARAYGSCPHTIPRRCCGTLPRNRKPGRT